jgi:hypothetical protein
MSFFWISNLSEVFLGFPNVLGKENTKPKQDALSAERVLKVRLKA